MTKFKGTGAVQVSVRERVCDSEDESEGRKYTQREESVKASDAFLQPRTTARLPRSSTGSGSGSCTSVTTSPSLPCVEQLGNLDHRYDASKGRNGRLCSVTSLHNLKHDLLAKYIFQQQCSLKWIQDSLEGTEGVLLRVSRGRYMACPEKAIDSPMGRAAVAMNLPCVITLNSGAIRSLLARSPSATDITIETGLRMQILPTMDALDEAKIAQNGAFIADSGILVVWDDDAWNLIRRCQSILAQTIDSTWLCKNDSELTFSVCGKEDLEIDPEAGRAPANERPTHLANAIRISLSVMLVIVFIGLGIRTIAIEVATDNDYCRLTILLIVPTITFFILFFCQTLVGNIAQCIGPIRQMQTNSKFYSASTGSRLKGSLPHVTIQCPVYKEGLKGVIQPTVQSIKAAITTYELQGGTANIFINEDGLQIIDEAERRARIEFYANNNIGWTARPRHGEAGFVRRGKFKKASNMNFGLMLSCKVEEKLGQFNRSAAWDEDAEQAAYDQCLKEVLEEVPRAWAEGNIRIGDYILLIDCDTRIPVDCLLDAVSEMEHSPNVGILQFSSGVLQMVNTYFENYITFFTKLVYTAIRYAVAEGDVSPFVGHNAMLRWSAVQQVAYMDEDGYEKFWSESHVSEDFDMSLRLQCQGYWIRLAAWAGEGFKEGVSLTVEDEVARWEKYAFGCNELLFHPIRRWIYKGPFTPLFRRFVVSNIPLTSKITIISYMGTYYAIGSAWVLTLANFFAIGWLGGYLDLYYLDSFKIWLTLMFVFTGLGNLAVAVMRHRITEQKFMYSLVENLKWIPCFSIFIGGLSLHVSGAILAHMFEIDMTWGATAKEAEVSNFFKEVPKVLKKFKWSNLYAVTCIAAMAVLSSDLVPWDWQIRQFVAIWPLAVMAGSHLLMPMALNPALMTFTF